MNFGRQHWFVRECIYKWLVDNKEMIGIEFTYNKDAKWEDTNKLYSVSNWIHQKLEVDNKDALAVLYKCDYKVIGEIHAGIRMHYNRVVGIRDAVEGEHFYIPEEYRDEIFR